MEKVNCIYQISQEKLIPEITIIAYQIRDLHDIELAKNSIAFPLLDNYSERSYGGTGEHFDWKLLTNFDRPYILAGGINRENINEVLILLQVWKNVRELKILIKWQKLLRR